MNKKKIIIIAILLGIVAYLYWKKKKAAEPASGPVKKAAPSKLPETVVEALQNGVSENVAVAAQELNVPLPDADLVEKYRDNVDEMAASNPDVKGVTQVNESAAINGKSYPVIGYLRLDHNGRQETGVMIPIGYVLDLIPAYAGGKYSSTAGAVKELTLNTGRYAGKHKVWYHLANDAWGTPRVHIYTEAAW
jgi:hypothetical protein